MTTETKTKDKPKSFLRRSALAYIGLYGMAYDRAQLRRKQARDLTEGLFEDLSERGETTFTQAELFIKQARIGAWKNYASTAEKVTEILPIPVKTKVEKLEAELASLEAKFDRMNKVAKPAKSKASKARTVKATASEKSMEKAETSVVVNTVKTILAAESAPKQIEKTETKTPRHIPYFLDVKRYDPLADEDVVRKIVNHCGIALRSEDARYVACSDESERVTVRESWLKRKLAITIDDKDLDKKVLDVCGLMQRDQKKNRVTFYYLLAKKERLLASL